MPLLYICKSLLSMTLCNKQKDSRKPKGLGSDVSGLPLIFSDNLWLAAPVFRLDATASGDALAKTHRPPRFGPSWRIVPSRHISWSRFIIKTRFCLSFSASESLRRSGGSRVAMGQLDDLAF